MAFICDRHAGTSRIRAKAKADLDRELAISQSKALLAGFNQDRLAKSSSLFTEISRQLVVRSHKLGDRDSRGNQLMCIALVVDDDRTQQLIISKLLRKIGLNVIFASDGVEALEQIQSRCPVLVILDIIMPRMNGYEVCRRLKEDDKTQKLPVVIYSGQEKEFDSSKESQFCADAYLSKLCHPQELIDIVNQFLPITPSK